VKIGATVCLLLFGFPAIGFGQLTGIKIGVDPGHGGDTGLNPIGAEGPTGLLEKNVNLATALKLQAYLIADGATVFITRTTDTSIDLQARTNYFITNHVNRAVSVHQNGGEPTTNTTMAFAYCGLCNELAGVLGAAVVNRLGNSTLLPLGPPAAQENERCPSGTFSCQVPGLGQADLWMVHVPWTQAQIPAILTEASFITNASEEARLYNPGYLDANAWAIYAGIADYYGVQPKPRVGTGSITIQATLDGQPWSGPVSYSVSGATSFTGTSTGSYPNLIAGGGYTVQYLSGGPGGFVEIVPASSQSLAVGATISWTLKFATACTAASGASGATKASSCPSPLVAALSASPASGNAPLYDVDLTASVSGTATGTINYTFYCDRPDAGTNITTPSDAKFDGITANPKTAAGICDYTIPKTYTAKVIVERGSYAVEKRTTIVVGQPPSGGVPIVTTVGATGITQSSASLNLTVNPNNNATTVQFDWGTNTNVTQTTASQNVGSSTSTIPASVTLGGLSCGTTYFFRARAQNTQGSATPGTILQFATASCGCGASQTVNLIQNGTFGADSASWTRIGNFYADRQFTDYHDGPGYAYLSQSNGAPGNGLNGELYQQVSIPSDATSATLRFWTKITTNEPTGGPAEDFLNATLQTSSGAFLAPLQIYSNQDALSSYVQRNFNLVNFIGQTIRLDFLGVTNTDSQPTVFRIDDVSLDVVRPAGSAPVVTTQSADQITATSARLNLTIDPNDAATTVWFDFDPNDSTPSTDTEHVAIGCGSQAVPASIGVFGLQCNTRYYFKAIAANSGGSGNGSTLQFTTSACAGSPPNADTDPATGVGQTSATLIANVTPNGLPTQAWFAWGTSTALGQETLHASVGSGTGTVDFSQGLSGLTCGTTYYFRNYASNAAGQNSGATHSFNTTQCTSASAALLFVSRQGCAGDQPAVLLGWTMPQGADPLVTIRRSDGQYVATVNTANQGPVFVVDSGLIFGNVYKFTLEAQVDGESLISNEITVPIASDECRLAVAAGDLPHPPVLWAKPAFCENGVAKVELFWTEATGAETYSLQRVGAFTPSATYDGLTARNFKDQTEPGAASVYLLKARNSSGYVNSGDVGVIVPGTVCTTTGAPGPFSASLENPICSEGKGSVIVHWGQSTGAASGYRVFELYDHPLVRLNDDQEHFVATLGQLDPGTVVRVVVQAESTTAPDKLREAYPVATFIPIDVCGAGTALPTVGGASALYIRADQAFVRASIIANGSDTTARFEWGTSIAYGSQTPSRATGKGYGFVTRGEVLTGLSCNTTYHFRVIASNSNGMSQGADGVFTTLSCPPTPVLTVTAADPTATESPMTTGEFLIQRTGSTAGDLTVAYGVGGTATAGIDYTLGSGSVIIPAGSASRTLTVSPLDDSLVESDETVILTLQPQSQYVVGTPSTATVTITSNDVANGNLISLDGFESGDTCGWSFMAGGGSQCSPP
jgi:hypothetical protein